MGLLCTILLSAWVASSDAFVTSHVAGGAFSKSIIRPGSTSLSKSPQNAIVAVVPSTNLYDSLPSYIRALSC